MLDSAHIPSFIKGGKRQYPIAKQEVKEGFEVVATAVDYDGVDMEKTEELAKSLGAKFRGRVYEVVG